MKIRNLLKESYCIVFLSDEALAVSHQLRVGNTKYSFMYPAPATPVNHLLRRTLVRSEQ